MCDICGRYYCPCGCPGDDGELAERGFPVAECAVCGRNLYSGMRVFYREEKTVCAECATLLETDTLLELTGCGETGTLLEELGFSDEIL